MPDLDDDGYHIEQQHEGFDTHRFELRREPTTDSLRALVDQTIVTIADGEELRTVRFIPKKGRTRRIWKYSKRLIHSKPQAVKDEEEETKKILHERAYRIKQTKAQQRKLNSSHESPINGKRRRRKKRDFIRAQIDTIRLEFDSSGYDDVPSPKSDDWFRTENLDPALNLVLKVQGQKIPTDPKLASKPFHLIEKGVDSLGRKLDSIRRRSGSLAGSTHPTPNTASKTPITTPILSALKFNSLRGLRSQSSALSNDPPTITTTAASPPLEDLSSPPLSSPYLTTARTSLSLEEFRNRTKSIEVPDVISENDEVTSQIHACENQTRDDRSQDQTILARTIGDGDTASQTRSDAFDQTEGTSNRSASQSRVKLSIVTQNLTVPASKILSTSQDSLTTCPSDLTSKIDLNQMVDTTPRPMRSQFDDQKFTNFDITSSQAVHSNAFDGQSASGLESQVSSSDPNLIVPPRSQRFRQRSETVTSILSSASSNSLHSTPYSHPASLQSSTYHDADATPMSLCETTLSLEHGSKLDKKRKGIVHHSKHGSISEKLPSPLLTSRAYDFGARKFNQHLSSRFPRLPLRSNRKFDGQHEIDVLNIYRGALDDDDSISPSSSNSSNIPQDHPNKAVKFETDILIQNEGGISFFGHDKFHERFRSEPWQTIKMIKRYERPGDYDSTYDDQPPEAKVVQTPYNTATFPLPTPHWRWVTDFEIDHRSRPVDSNGWEYYDIYHHEWKGHSHGCTTFRRRRRWLRTRVKDSFKLRHELLRVHRDHTTGTTAEYGRGHSGSDYHKLSISNESHSIDPSTDAPSISATPHSMILKIKRVGTNQVMKLTGGASVMNPVLPDTQPFGLIWRGGDLDYHNPFFSYQKLLIDFKRLFKLQNPKVVSSSGSTTLGLSFASIQSPAHHHNPVTWNEDDLIKQIGGPWKDKLAAINLSRALKVLIDFSEHQKVKIWRYWLGLDTYAQDRDFDRPDPQDVWQVIERHLDEILQIFVYQHSRSAFLHVISQWHQQSHSHHKVSSKQESHLPDCLSPVINSRQRSRRESIDNPEVREVDQTKEHHVSRSKVTELIRLHAQSRFSFWNDISSLVIKFNWKINDEINLKAKVAKEIRIELNRLVKINLKKWTKQGR